MIGVRAELASLRIPLCVHHDTGFDGDTYGVKLHGQVELEWWCNGPEERGPVVRWALRVMELLRSA